MFNTIRIPFLLGLEKYLYSLHLFLIFRVDDWAFMWSPWPTLACCMLYYYVMRIWGPRYC